MGTLTNEQLVADAKRVFEYSYCEDCGLDVEDHEFIVGFPFPGTVFTRCLKLALHPDDAPDLAAMPLADEGSVA